ncbi:hypothetical protein POM88_029236 [Heracleum sosnowskyi]|uniref:Helitron helicase-like domain-containing protein n=1 Tax=Heracleum sosnowskyi TaxID=360622 RepID=A0AAD8HUB3_9APIA|nr:hypothetical protein POM88_029236 [Heracleum sosnowskyi]
MWAMGRRDIQFVAQKGRSSCHYYKKHLQSCLAYCLPKFAQLYMYDGQEAIDHRVNCPRNRDDVDPSIVQTLQDMLERDNCLVGIFKQVRLRFNDAEQIPVRLRLFERRLSDGRFETMPNENDYEFAALAVDNDFANERDIVAEDKRFGLKHISDLHPSFMSLQYPLLFPFGEDGYRTNIKHRNVTASEGRPKNTLDAMMDDFTKNDVFGRVLAVVYTVEFQKRGLPHAHIVLWLQEEIWEERWCATRYIWIIGT